MARLAGRNRCETRLVAAAPHGHWRTTTFVAALRNDQITAPSVVGRRRLTIISPPHCGEG